MFVCVKFQFSHYIAKHTIYRYKTAKVIAPFLIPSNKKEWFGNEDSEEPVLYIRTATANGITTDGAQTLQGADEGFTLAHTIELRPILSLLVTIGRCVWAGLLY